MRRRRSRRAAGGRPPGPTGPPSKPTSAPPAALARLLAGLLAVGLLAGALAAVLLVRSPGPAAAASPGATPTSEPVRIAIDSIEPKAPKPGDLFSVVGSLANTGADQLAGLRLRLDIGARLDNRSSLQDAARQSPAYQRSTAADPVPIALAPGGVAPFISTVPVDELGLGRLGVYPLRVSVRDHAGRSVGHLDTFLPWFPGGVLAGSATRLAWVWPLTTRPHRAVGRALIDDDLTRDVSAGGRLDTLLNAAATAAAPVATPDAGSAAGAPRRTAPVPVTWAVDADLVETVASMTTPYDVTGPDGQRRTGAGTIAAGGWLTRLRAAVQGQQVVSLPYADPDVNALARAGLEADVATAINLARDGLPRLLDGALVSDDIAWPPAGMASPAGLDAYVNTGTSTVMLDDSAAPVVPPPCCSTPSGHATITSAGRSLDVALLDSGLGAVLAGSAAVAGGPRVAEQRFLAETAMITAERADSRAIVAAPPRQWAPDPTYAASVLADTATVPWLRPAALADVLAVPPPVAQRRSLNYPAAAVAAELPPAFLARAAGARAEMRSLRSSLPNDDLTTPVLLGLLRSASAAWREDLRTGAALRDRVVAAQAALVDKVRVTSTGQVTLTSSHGAIPVTIANDLDQPVSVIVRLDARNAARLQATGDVQTVAAHSSKQISVRADALTSGEFIVNVTLLTLDGGTLGERGQLQVRSTGYGRVALGITGGAAGLLLVVAGVRISRRALLSRHRPATPETPARQDVPV